MSQESDAKLRKIELAFRTEKRFKVDGVPTLLASNLYLDLVGIMMDLRALGAKANIPPEVFERLFDVRRGLNEIYHIVEGE